MINFLKSLYPNIVPPHLQNADDLTIVRERILQMVLLAATFAGLIVYISNLVPAINSNSYFLIIAFSFVYAILLFLALRRRIDYRLRATTFLVLVYANSLINLIQYGLQGGGREFLLTFSVMGTLLLGLGAGSVTFFTGFLTLIFTAVLRTSTSPLVNAGEVYSIEQGSTWISAIFIFLIANVILTGSIQIILLNLQNIIAAGKSLAENLKQEQTKLISEAEHRTELLISRANQLEAANQISQLITSETDPSTLCEKVANEIKDRLGYYYASVFLLDDKKEFAVLKAGTGDAGKALLARKHSLKVGEIGMVGYVVSRGETKVSQNVLLDPIHFKNPLLPDTKSEIAIPLISANQIIGALDVQSIVEDAFSSDVVKTLQTISDQLATSLDRSNLVKRLQETLSQMDTGYRQFTESAWQNFLRSSQITRSYRYRASVIEPSEELSEMAQGVLSQKNQQPVQSIVKSDVLDKPVTALAIPILLRNQILGVIDIRFEGENISKDTLSLLESTSARLAIALENARLLEESQNRANREHLVSNISARVRSSTEVSGILQTAASELGRILGVPEVMVQLRSSTNE